MVIGVIAGIIFLVYDQSRPQNSPDLPDTPIPTAPIMPTFDPNATATPLFSGQLAVTPSPTPIDAGEIEADIENALLTIPSAGIYAPIVQVYLNETSWDVSRLGNNIGHLQGTRWVSETGNVVLSGHVELADGRQGIFANIGELNIGDRIILSQNGVNYHYDVSSINTVDPDDLSPIYPSRDNLLTLITCGNYDFFSDSYLQRIVVVAQQIQVN